VLFIPDQRGVDEQAAAGVGYSATRTGTGWHTAESERTIPQGVVRNFVSEPLVNE
jgi:hypothetical protein